MQQAVKRATRVNIALGGLRYLRPEQMRQLYQACVALLSLVGQRMAIRLMRLDGDDSRGQYIEVYLSVY